MISGDKTRKIVSYLYIDYCAEGFGFTKPDAGETFVGFPSGWYVEDAPAFIEVRNGERLVRTVNPLALCEIEFDADEKA